WLGNGISARPVPRGLQLRCRLPSVGGAVGPAARGPRTARPHTHASSTKAAGRHSRRVSRGVTVFSPEARSWLIRGDIPHIHPRALDCRRSLSVLWRNMVVVLRIIVTQGSHPQCMG